MRVLALFLTVSSLLSASSDNPAAKLWNDLKAKRESLSSFHQEFESSLTYQNAHGSRTSKRQVILDVAQPSWREQSVSGAGNYQSIFNGSTFFSVDESSAEYVVEKYGPKKQPPQPAVYDLKNASWHDARELKRIPCELPNVQHQCVVLDVPFQHWTRMRPPSGTLHLADGGADILIDIDTGLILSSRIVEDIETGNSTYRAITTYTLQRMVYGAAKDNTLFDQPSANFREVKDFSPWDAAKVKKQLVGHPAPELTVTDLHGTPITLSSLKGKTVLLDFWTSWCPPCRADGPALEKIYRRYGATDLAIIGISVNEERDVINQYLDKHPHTYPIVLTADNDMPRPYQVNIYPTYIVIDRDGNVTAATEGDKGFADLRKLLKKAGLETE